MEKHTLAKAFNFTTGISGGRHSFLSSLLKSKLINERNLGIILSLMLFLCCLYLIATEYIAAQKSKGEVLVYRRGEAPFDSKVADEKPQGSTACLEALPTRRSLVGQISPQKQSRDATFAWDSLNYDVKTKEGTRRLLDDVEGWVEPGKVTALMVRFKLWPFEIFQDN